MTKRLNTTVHLFDPETGDSRMVGPNDKLSRADVKALREGWGKAADRFFDDDGDEDDPAPEEVSQEEHAKAGRPTASETPPVKK